MTPSLMPNNSSMPSDQQHPIIQKLFPFHPSANDSDKALVLAKRALLQLIFTRFEINNNFSSYQLFLDRLDKLLNKGISSEASSEWNKLEDMDLNKEWKRWQEIIAETKDILRGKYSDDKPISSIENKTNSKRVNCILQRRYKETKINQTGLMLLYLATLMLPDERLKKLNIKDLTISFKKAVSFTEIFSQLPFDFSNKPREGLISTQTACSNLIQKDVFDDNYKEFLRFIINTSEIFITGKYTHSRKKTNNLTSSKQTKTTNSSTKTYRQTKFYDAPQDDEVPNIGTFCSIDTEAGEESAYGLLEPTPDTQEEITIPKECSDAELKVGSKYWLQQYSDAIPWNSNGINPFTLKILTQWIKAHDSTASLILAMLICIGIKTKAVMNLTIGKSGDITHKGEYERKYIPPSKPFMPDSEQQKTLIPTTDTISIKLPEFVIKMLNKHIDKSDGNITLSQALKINHTDMEDKIISTFKELKLKGAKGLALDRIHVSLRKKLSQMTDDDLIGYLITGTEGEAAPISSYYSRINQEQLQEIYNQAIEELFKC